MIKKVCFYIFLFFCFALNIILDMNIKNYIEILNKCFDKNIVISNGNYMLICSIIALISILTILDILLVVNKKTNENKGVKIKSEDGTFGTANWMQENEITQVLGINDTPGIILGKYKENIVKLPFDSYFNKNICVFGSSGSMKTIRLFTYKPIRTFKVQKIYNCNRPKRRNLQDYFKLFQKYRLYGKSL